MTRHNLALLVLLACVAALPLFGGAYALRLGTVACMYAILALSWNVVGGFAGYPSFATAAFFGFGAYMAGVLLNDGLPLLASIVLTLAASFLLAAVLGAVLLRLRGHYFAIASLSLGEVLRELVNNATDLTGGGMGLNIPLASGSGILADGHVLLLCDVGRAAGDRAGGNRSLDVEARLRACLHPAERDRPPAWSASMPRSTRALRSGCRPVSSAPPAGSMRHGCIISIRPTCLTCSTQ